MDITALLAFGVKNKASDLHLSSGLPPMIRVHGAVRRINLPAMDHKVVHRLIYDIMNDKQRKDYEEFFETDFSFEVPGVARFRVNAFNQNHVQPEKMRRNIAFQPHGGDIDRDADKGQGDQPGPGSGTQVETGGNHPNKNENHIHPEKMNMSPSESPYKLYSLVERLGPRRLGLLRHICQQIASVDPRGIIRRVCGMSGCIALIVFRGLLCRVCRMPCRGTFIESRKDIVDQNVAESPNKPYCQMEQRIAVTRTFAGSGKSLSFGQPLLSSPVVMA